ncbi:MAG: hypothetical protein ACXQTL_02330 [Methanosarcinales archaeon]
MKKRTIPTIATVIFIILLASVATNVAANETTSVLVNPANMESDKCDTVSIMIETDDPQGIGSATMTLVYDPLVVDYNGKVADGDLGGVTINENPVGTLTMVAATGASPGPTGTVKFVELEFCPVGDPSECSDLDLTVTELTDGTAGNPQVIVPDSVTDGEFCILSGVVIVCGDVAPYPDGNGVVTMDDVTHLLNHVGYPAGYPVEERTGDVNCDGRIDMGDVILLLNRVGDPVKYPLGCCEE